jgi:hypothetical protein
MTHEQAVQTLAAEQYLLGEMNELERQDFEAHFFDCAECAEEVRTGLTMADGVRATEGERSGKVVLFGAQQRTRRWVSAYLPLAAAASLAVVASYQAFVTIPALQSAQGPRALNPVVLRSASRGELPEVPLDGRAGLVAFALDVNLTSQPTEVLYDLTSEAGVSVASGRVGLPRLGTPLLILVPGGALSVGRYTVTVRDPAAPQSDAGTYPFVVR